MTTWTTLASDSYDRANGTAVGSAPDNANGGSHVNTYTAATGAGTWNIVSNVLVNPDVGGGPNYFMLESEADAADVAVEVVLLTSPDSGVVARWTSGVNWYLLYWYNTGALYFYNSADLIFDTVLLGSAVSGDTVRIEPLGDDVTVLVNGSIRHTGTVPSGPPDLRVSTGKPGLYSGTNFNNSSFNNFTYQTAAAVATKLGVTTQPAGNASGTAFTTQPVVAVQDAGSSTVTSDTSTVVATLNTISGSGSLSGTTSKAAVAGVATFTNLTVTGAGSFTITFTDGALTSATTATFYVGATQLAFTTTPSVVYSRRVHSNLVVTIQDAGGNTMTGLTSSVTVAAARTSSGTSIFERHGSAGTVTRNAVAGVATFNDLEINCTSNDVLTTTGTYTATCGALTATSGSIPGIVRGWTLFTGA